DARKDSNGVDCAVEVKLIPQLKLFLSKLNEYSGVATSPLVDGVVSRIVEAGPDTGYAVTLVPESLAGPDMAKLGEDRYYKRNGSSFYRLEHFDLEDMFGRRPRPRLDLDMRLVRAGGSQGGRSKTICGKAIISLVNTGRGLARSPYLGLYVTRPY